MKWVEDGKATASTGSKKKKKDATATKGSEKKKVPNMESTSTQETVFNGKIKLASREHAHVQGGI